MYFSSITLENHKSFYGRQTVELDPGINLLVGPNNSGKTTLLNALELSSDPTVHRSPQTLPSPENKVFEEPGFDFQISCTSEEILDACGTDPFVIITDFSDSLETPRLVASIEDYLAPGESRHLRYHKNHVGLMAIYLQCLPYFEQVEDGDPRFFGERLGIAEVKIESREPELRLVSEGEGKLLEHFARRVLLEQQSRVYQFDAIRAPEGRSSVTDRPVLEGDASNLAVALQNLDPGREHPRLSELLSRVFPSVEDFRTRRKSGSPDEVEVQIRKFEDHPHLDVFLGDCGSGVAQVLAILYLLVTSDRPRTILIDEPASFLHPDAARELMRIIDEEGKQHQFVIATHSPVIISAVRDASIVYVGIEDGVSFTEQIDPTDNQNIQRMLGGLGTKLSDIFGAERIIWAEGPTEEQCLPLLIDEMCDNGMPYGTIVRDVEATGDFEGDDAKRVFKIYENLSDGHALLPTGVAYIFDREDKDHQEVENLERLGKDGPHDEESRIHLLDRRMYESYLLHPEALHHAIQNAPVVPDDVAETIGVDDVEERFDEVLSKRWLDFCDRTNTDDSDDDARTEWRRRELHAANALEDILRHWDLKHRKPLYGRLMTEWILHNEPRYLQPLAAQLDDILEQIAPDG